MTKFLFLILVVLFIGIPSFAQHAGHPDMQNQKGEAGGTNKENAPVNLKAGEKITRGAALAKGVTMTTVAKAFAEPASVDGKTVEVSGVIVRSCKQEGCWMEMADKEGGKSVRVTFGDHAFFIPLNAAGMKVRAQGVFTTKVLPKEHVDHLIQEDGAKFDNRNPDGSVTEVSFDATGVELIRT